MAALQRLASCVGLGLGAPRIAAAAASSSSALWLRAYSGEAAGGGDKPAEPEAAPAGATAEAAADAEVPVAAEEAAAEDAAAEVHPALIDADGSVVPQELFSKRQLTRMGVLDPERTKHFLPRLSRAELGSYADDYVAEEFDVEVDMYPEVPENVPLYNLREVVPEIYEPRSDLLDRLRRLKDEKYAGMPVQQFIRDVLGFNEPEEQPPRPGARRIIRWEIKHVYAVGVTARHPANRRVKAYVYLRDLQEQYGLTDAALQHIAAVCGPRYNANKGQLKLTSDRYEHREANRAHIRKMIDDLVAEGHRKHPAPQQQEAAQQQAAAQQAASQQQTAA
ncbi:28S ribosomal mitochondrial [Chlorella sorokiniana]|uniref:28S ribosomal mitochondrial n=1 Tax=Chlorella sorokiniana TaxID=3076 RepID=A0A2P6TX45_CHLSO|nr:28S ribosomal mitochondrial [Chlorella sorokiniana]|eukprot:PRW58621.1 28S ribosomal mitochondrial [Chlorella sorokiniana]